MSLDFVGGKVKCLRWAKKRPAAVSSSCRDFHARRGGERRGAGGYFRCLFFFSFSFASSCCCRGRRRVAVVG